MFPETGTCEVHANQCSILGTPGSDTLLGGPTADLICGLGGDDTIEGGDGDDTLIGGPGDDRLVGGNGRDCLLAGAGHDELPDFDPAQDIGRTQDPVGGQPPSPDVPSVESDGRCRTESGGGAPAGGGARQFGEVLGEESGPVDSAAQTGTLIVSISRLLEEDAAQQAGAFPVMLVPYARAKDGVARLLLECPGAPHSGTLVLERKVGGRRRPAGRARFTCAPPSELVTVQVTRAVRRRLDDRGSVRLTVRIIVDGLKQEGAARLTVRADAG